MTALNNLHCWQIPQDFLVVCETIRVAGNPSKHGGLAMYVGNALRPNGEEILLLANAKLRWSDRKGMPTIMEAPYPWEFIQDREKIVLHQEEYDTWRTIHMGPDASAAGELPSLLGYSVGHWDRDTLIVRTTNSNWRHFDTLGVPLE